MNDSLDPSDPYDISKYTDHELYLILDLVNQQPTDRELEAKIIQNIKKYSLIETDIAKKLTVFFSNMYDHFFEPSQSQQPQQEGFDTFLDTLDPTKIIPNATPSDSILTYGSTDKVTGPPPPPPPPPESDVILTKSLNVSKGKLNPVLNQTITRVISIDSQFRDNLNNKIQTLSTDFTFDLSEPLKDVVSLKLYSIQLPYTWYTIDSAFGSNFFILEPKSTSLLNGNYIFKFSIPAGNYTNTTIFQSLSASIDTVKNTFTDVQFGSTNFSYDPISALTTMTFDIQNIYNETKYELVFGGNPTPYNIFKRTDSIANFLGYSFPSYSTSSIYSQFNNVQYHFYNDHNLPLYYINASNQSFQIIHYIATPTTLNNNAIPTVINTQINPNYSPGSPQYIDISSTTQIINTYTISFSNQIQLNHLYTRTELLNDLNNQLNNTTIYPFLSTNSNISLIGISDLSSSYNITDVSFVKLNIELDRTTTANQLNSKIVISFPNETNLPNPTYRYIWRDISNNGTSCFNFTPKQTLFELNNIYGDTLPAITNYDISLNPYILLKCIREPYDFSLNNYVLKLPNFTSYTLNNYIREINRSIFYANKKNSSNELKLPYPLYTQSDISNNDIPSILNPITWNTYCYQNPTDQHIHFQFDISKKINETQYIIDVSNTILQNILNIQVGNSDISLNNPFLCKFPVQANGYYVHYNQPLVNILLKTEYTGSPINYVKYNVYMDASGDQSTDIHYFSTANEMIQTMNTVLKNFTFYYRRNKQDFSGNPLKNTTLSSLQNINYQYQTELNIQINIELTTNDYQVVFYDTSGGGKYDADGYYNKSPWSSTGSWATNLKMTNQIYDLSNITIDKKSIIQSNGYVLQDEILLTTENNTITFQPIITANGLYSDLTNTIMIDVSAGYPYQQYELIDDINSRLRENSLTNGSYMYIENNICRLRLNINKIYTANDYNLVFYDNVNFVKCYIGATSVRNVSWDSTLGWILGFRQYTTYDLSELPATMNPANNVITIIGDTTVALTLYNYFMIILDDFNQNHLNDGLVTITKKDYAIYNASYTKKSPNVCSNSLNSTQITPTDEAITANYQNGNNQMNMTQNQIYAHSQLLNANQTNNNILQTSPGPYIKDIFGLIPLKTTGLSPGQPYIEFGGTLQAQERKYFGPVNIHRMHIQLLNDHGDIVNLNGQNWSFSLLCEQLYQSNNI
jgi:hypothetical protein